VIPSVDLVLMQASSSRSVMTAQWWRLFVIGGDKYHQERDPPRGPSPP
jgi:hypothetical protein